MAITGKTVSLSLGISNTVLYTCPLNTTTTVTFFQASNTTATNVVANVNVNMYDTSASITESLCRNVAVLPGDPISLLTGNLNLEAGDRLEVFASAAAPSVDVAMSFWEQT